MNTGYNNFNTATLTGLVDINADSINTSSLTATNINLENSMSLQVLNFSDNINGINPLSFQNILHINDNSTAILDLTNKTTDLSYSAGITYLSNQLVCDNLLITGLTRIDGDMHFEGSIINVSQGVTITNDELRTLNGIIATSTIQEQLNAKEGNTTIINANRIANGTVSNEIFQYINTLSSNCQEQLTELQDYTVVNTSQIIYEAYKFLTTIFNQTYITTLTCGNFNTSHLSNTSGNIQNQITQLQNQINTLQTQVFSNLAIEYKIGGYNSTTGTSFPSSVTIPVPTNAIYADVMVIGVGGKAGNGNDRTLGYITGGSGGGAIASSGRIYCRNLVFVISLNGTTGVTLSVGGITIITVNNGNAGGNSDGVTGGIAGVANVTLPSIPIAGYTSWFNYTGTVGVIGRINNPPTDVGKILRTGYNTSGQMGCGQSISGITNGGSGIYASQTSYSGGLLITYYSR